ncbi:MAG: hypothetical protein AAB907_04215, partial [Patescibacteria group bacterium]
DGHTVVGRDRDIQEVMNYRKVMEYIDELGSRNYELGITEEMIKKMHTLTVQKILADEQCGQFRKKQVVVRNNKTGEVTFRPSDV